MANKEKETDISKKDEEDSSVDESPLEEVIEEAEEELDVEIPEEISEFIAPTPSPASSGSGAPVLEEQGLTPAGPRFIPLEQTAQESPEATRDSGDPFNYASSPDEEQETKYTDTSNIGRGPERVDMAEVGRGRIGNEPGEANFVHAEELKGIESDTSVKYIESKEIDPTRVGREDRFKPDLKEAERKKSDYIMK